MSSPRRPVSDTTLREVAAWCIGQNQWVAMLRREVARYREMTSEVEDIPRVARRRVTAEDRIPSVRSRSAWRTQWAALRFAVLAGYLPAFLLLCALVAIRLRYGILIEDMTRDPAAVVSAPFYVGAVSNFGMVLWGACAGSCFLGCAMLRGAPDKRDLRLFLLFSGIITCALMLDDLLQFHEVVYPTYIAIPQRVTYAAYLLAGLAYLVRFRGAIARTPYLLAALAAVFLGMSAGLDQLPSPLPAQFLFEDGFKLMGIVSWLMYLAQTTLAQAVERVSP